MRKKNKNRENRRDAKVKLDEHPDVDKEIEKLEGEDKFDGLSVDVKRLLKYRSKTVSQLRSFWSRKCHKCKEIKPARVHHCSMCNRCVFQMDHHCRK